MKLRIYICLICATERTYGVSRNVDYEPLLNCEKCGKLTRHRNSMRDKEVGYERISLERPKTGMRLM